MSLFAALKAKSFLEAFLLFLWGKLLEFYHVNVHGIGVFSHSRGKGKGLESLGRPSASLSNLLHAVPLILKMNSFGVPVINFVWYSVKGHDLLHGQGGDSSSEEADEHVVVYDASIYSVTLEC